MRQPMFGLKPPTESRGVKGGRILPVLSIAVALLLGFGLARFLLPPERVVEKITIRERVVERAPEKKVAEKPPKVIYRPKVVIVPRGPGYSFGATSDHYYGGITRSATTNW